MGQSFTSPKPCNADLEARIITVNSPRSNVASGSDSAPEVFGTHTTTTQVTPQSQPQYQSILTAGAVVSLETVPQYPQVPVLPSPPISVHFVQRRANFSAPSTIPHVHFVPPRIVTRSCTRISALTRWLPMKPQKTFTCT